LATSTSSFHQFELWIDNHKKEKSEGLLHEGHNHQVIENSWGPQIYQVYSNPQDVNENMQRVLEEVSQRGSGNREIDCALHRGFSTLLSLSDS
jgi:hypothetical protein